MIGIPQLAAGVVVEELDPDLCLFRPDIDEVVLLNQTAADVVRLVDGASPVETITKQLGTVYQLSAADIEPEVRQVLTDLRDRGYLVETSQTPSTNSGA